MASPSSSEPQVEDIPNWLELPPDLTALILRKLGPVHILATAQNVCKTWRNICKDPSMWRVIDMHDSVILWPDEFDLRKVAKHAVERSSGQLVDVNFSVYGTDELLSYTSDRSSKLTRLRVVMSNCITSNGLIQAVQKLPLLEELHLFHNSISVEAIEAIGHCCPLLKSFKLNNRGYTHPLVEYDDEARAIAANMPELRHLDLFGNNLTNDGLQAILDGCPHLESLDLRGCFNVILDGNLGRRCSEQIKDLMRPYDAAEDINSDYDICDSESFDEDYPSGFSDIDILSSDGDYYEFSDSTVISYYDGFLFD